MLPPPKSLLPGVHGTGDVVGDGQTRLLSSHLQVLQSSVRDTRVREAASPEWGEVGRVKLVVLPLVLEVIIKPGALVFVP